MKKGRGEEIRESIGRKETEGDTERKEADQLFSKFAAYELAFAYLLFESFGRQS